MKLFSAALVLASTASVTTGQSVISMHGSGTTTPSKCYWQIMDQLQTQAKLPIKMTYRAVGSSTGQAEFIGNVTPPDNMFGSGDIPIGSDDYALFPTDSILHLPVVLGAISFFHSVPTGNAKLNISPCLLAKILSRKITDWTDEQVRKPTKIIFVTDIAPACTTANCSPFQYLELSLCAIRWLPKTLD